jgi:hypothetical protein
MTHLGFYHPLPQWSPDPHTATQTWLWPLSPCLSSPLHSNTLVHLECKDTSLNPANWLPFAHFQIPPATLGFLLSSREGPDLSMMVVPLLSRVITFHLCSDLTRCKGWKSGRDTEGLWLSCTALGLLPACKPGPYPARYSWTLPPVLHRSSLQMLPGLSPWPPFPA